MNARTLTWIILIGLGLYLMGLIFTWAFIAEGQNNLFAAMFALCGGTAMFIHFAWTTPPYRQYIRREIRWLVYVIGIVAGLFATVILLMHEVDNIWLYIAIISPMFVILLLLMQFCETAGQKNKTRTSRDGAGAGCMKSMNRRERYMMQRSIKDAMDILDSVPMRRDLQPDFSLMQLTNRAPIAHLEIEKSLKALIADAAGIYEETHGINRLYEAVRTCDTDSADFLEVAFQDAVKFFRYNVNIGGFKHFRSLYDYLCQAANESVFNELRYWAIGEQPKAQGHIEYISLPIHRELLCALRCLIEGRCLTVSARVEREVTEAMSNGRHIVHMDGDICTKRSVEWYKNWLFRTHATRCAALEEAVQGNFAVKDDEFITQTLLDAYNDLRQSKDPAVQYYIGTLSYLPKGSQPRISNADPEVQWLNKDQTIGRIDTPAGTCLGFIERHADGGWVIDPIGIDQDLAPRVAKAAVDAKFYLVNGLTSQVNVTVNGETRLLRMVGKRFFLPDVGWSSGDVDPGAMGIPATTCPLEFWDAGHGLRLDEQVRVVIQSDTNDQFVSVLNGTVTSVEGQKVSIAGVIVGMSAESVGYDGVSD